MEQPAPDTVSTGAASSPAQPRYGVWTAVIGDPGYAPELLALAAVEMIGPRAAAWASRIRETYPAATPEGVARLAVAQFARRGGAGGALAALAGSYAPIALLGSAAWTQAELVLHVAAAYGRNAADPARAADLLVLTRVHPAREDAEAALSTARQPTNGAAESAAAGGFAGESARDAVWRLGRMLAAQLGGWAAVRAVGRVFPGTGLLVASLTSRGAAENLGVRAIAFYRAK
jgi:hypothetical protein